MQSEQEQQSILLISLSWSRCINWAEGHSERTCWNQCLSMLPSQGLLVLACVHLTLARIVSINRNEWTLVTTAQTACVVEAGFWLKCAGLTWDCPPRELRSSCPYGNLFLGSKKHIPFASGWLWPEQGWDLHRLGMGLGYTRPGTGHPYLLTPAPRTTPTTPCCQPQWATSVLSQH